MKSTKFWVILISAFFLLSAIASYFVLNSKKGDAVAEIYFLGECIDTIVLNSVDEEYTFVLRDEFINYVTVQPGRIAVTESTCPDKVCVKTGFIEGGAVPIVCLPNNLVIKISKGESVVDGVSG